MTNQLFTEILKSISSWRDQLNTGQSQHDDTALANQIMATISPLMQQYFHVPKEIVYAHYEKAENEFSTIKEARLPRITGAYRLGVIEGITKTIKLVFDKNAI